MFLRGLEGLIGIDLEVDELERLCGTIGCAEAVFTTRVDSRTWSVRSGKTRPHVSLHRVPPRRGEQSPPDGRFAIVAQRSIRIAAGILVILRLNADRFGIGRPATRCGEQTLQSHTPGFGLSLLRLRLGLRR